MKRKLFNLILIIFIGFMATFFAGNIVRYKITEKLNQKEVYVSISSSNSFFYLYGIDLYDLKFEKCGMNVSIKSIKINFIRKSVIVNGGEIKSDNSKFLTYETCLKTAGVNVSTNNESKYKIEVSNINFEIEYLSAKISGTASYKDKLIKFNDIKAKYKFINFEAKSGSISREEKININFDDFSIKIDKKPSLQKQESDWYINFKEDQYLKKFENITLELNNGTISINDYGTWSIKQINIGWIKYTIEFAENQTIFEPINLSGTKIFGMWSSPNIGKYIINVENFGIKHKILSDIEIKIDKTNLDIEYSKENGFRTLNIEYYLKDIEGILQIERNNEFYRMSLTLNPIECQKFINSLPNQLVPILKGVKFSGNIKTWVEATYYPEQKQKSDFKVKDFKIGCKFIEVPEVLQTKQYKRIFDHTIYTKTGERTIIKMGPGTKDWFPLSVMSSFVQRSVTTCEDPYFEVHTPVLPIALENSIKENIRTGKFMRGGSTISMQLAKNLWLDRSKNLSRKLQEMFLAYWLEQSMSKEEILELYLNVIEFGPDTYGIKQGAEYYFKSSPANLTFSQALFLASILPNPKAFRFGPDGALNPGHLYFLRRIMKSMYELKLISEPEYRRGIEETPIFGKSEISDKDMKLNDDEGSALGGLETVE